MLKPLYNISSFKCEKDKEKKYTHMVVKGIILNLYT
jgi:hypothetical protein